jgi:hypothetical protein
MRGGIPRVMGGLVRGGSGVRIDTVDCFGTLTGPLMRSVLNGTSRD